MSSSSTRRGPLAALGIYLGLSAAALIMAAPLLFSFMTAFKSPKDFASHSPFALPSPFSLESFGAVLGGRIAFARIDFPGRDLVFWLFLATMMIPATVLVVPLYLMLARMGLNNTFWGIVTPFVFASPYAVFLLRQSFRQIPQELIDAATLDGAGTWRILWSLVLPMSKPILATLTLITVVSHWNSFMWPRIIAAQRPKVITVATAALQSQYNANWTYVMAATTIALVPLIALFIAFQRQIVGSIALTGLK